MRRILYVSLSQEMWRRRLVFLAGAVVVGVVSVGFAKGADGAQDIYSHLFAKWPSLPLIMTPLGFAIIAGITHRWFPAATGSGIPQVIAARASHNDAMRRSLLGFDTMVAKMVLTTLAIFFGASVGREGPTVQIGASIMFAIGGLVGMGHRNGLVLGGAAAGIAAAFNAPLAGIVFAIEELAKAFDGRINEMVIASVVIAGGVSWLLVGNYPYFGELLMPEARPYGWMAIPISAIFGGVLGGLFSRAMITLKSTPPAYLSALFSRPMTFAALCGIVVALLSIATNGYASGNGYAEMRAGLEHGVELPWWYGLAKMLTALLSSISGIPGGLFSPSLAVGGGIGSMAGTVFTWIDTRVLVLLMMAGYFAAVVQSPLTASIIVMEMTSHRDMIIPLMATSVLATYISRRISPEPLYHALAKDFVRRTPP